MRQPEQFSPELDERGKVKDFDALSKDSKTPPAQDHVRADQLIETTDEFVRTHNEANQERSNEIVVTLDDMTVILDNSLSPGLESEWIIDDQPTTIELHLISESDDEVITVNEVKLMLFGSSDQISDRALCRLLAKSPLMYTFEHPEPTTSKRTPLKNRLYKREDILEVLDNYKVVPNPNGKGFILGPK